MAMKINLDSFQYFFTEDVVVAVSLSGMLNIWMLKPSVDSKVQSITRHLFQVYVTHFAGLFKACVK